MSEAQVWMAIGASFAAVIAMCGLVLRAIQAEFRSVGNQLDVGFGGQDPSLDSLESTIDRIHRNVRRLLEDKSDDA